MDAQTELDDVLDEIEEYLDDYSDADCDGGVFIPNKPMRLLMELKMARENYVRNRER
jgi:hypothetical protein